MSTRAGGAAPPPPGAPSDAAADRTAHLLALVLERSPRTLTELAEAVEVSPPETEPLVAALEGRGLLAWNGDRTGLRPGPAALRFARSGVGREDLIELAGPSLRRLADESGETVNLIMALPLGTEAAVQVDGRHLLGATNWIGRELPLHCTAAGKVFLAFGAAALPAGELARLTPATVVDRERLERELHAVREEGYASIVDELEDGLSAVAAPVRERGGGVVAALALSGASLRLAPQRLRTLGRVTVEQAQAPSARLGHDATAQGYR